MREIRVPLDCNTATTAFTPFEKKAEELDTLPGSELSPGACSFSEVGMWEENKSKEHHSQHQDQELEI